MSIRSVLREPLLHFVALGAMLFVLDAAVRRDAPARADAIVVDRARIAGLVARFERVWLRPPTPAERDGLVASFVREEVLYREGLALGLDRDDPVIRRRIGQKMAFLADAEARAEASDAELQAWLDAHPDAYRVPSHTTLRQVFFDPARRGARLEAEIAAARAALGAGRDAQGDATLLPATLDRATDAEIARVFGDAFAEAVATLPAGGWHGPVASSYGVHLVEIGAREAGRVPALAEVREAVERDLLQARADEASDAFYESLRRRYEVIVDDSAAPLAQTR